MEDGVGGEIDPHPKKTTLKKPSLFRVNEFSPVFKKKDDSHKKKERKKELPPVSNDMCQNNYRRTDKRLHQHEIIKFLKRIWKVLRNSKLLDRHAETTAKHYK